MELKEESKMADGPSDKPPPYTESFQNPTAPNVTVPVSPMGAMVVVQPLGPRSTNITCQSCNQQIQTRVEFQPTTKTHLFALVLCLVGCWPLACLPYCMDSCNGANHYCPSCNSFVGTYVD